MEVSFHKEIQSLKLGKGETFHGEGILAVTKALLQSGVAYVGGYQGAPVSHLLDVLVQSEDILEELGIHLETCTNEAAAAAMLAASVQYPMRGCVTWKSIVGTNVAADALSNLASPGVIGGTLIVVGEDYGEGASVIQERTHAYALKSSLWLLDPRPELTKIVDMVEKSFELSEASNTPVIMELRIRACHVFGDFEAKDNVAAPHSTREKFKEPTPFNYARLAHPPETFIQEKDKVARRLPAARDFIVREKLNEFMGPTTGEIGIITQGGLFNGLNSCLADAGLSDAYGNLDVPVMVLNVTHPLVPEQITDFAKDKKAILIVEEGSPEYIELAVGKILRQADLQTKIHGKDMLPEAGEYTAAVVGKGVSAFLDAYGIEPGGLGEWLDGVDANQKALADGSGDPLPPRPPTFCTGCPERPVFSAMKLVREELGPVHVSVDIGCHALATFPPFSQGHSIIGYGMSLAAASAVSGTQEKRPFTVMGDGGFWHNGLLTGVAGSVFNQDDSVLIVMDNGYSSATGAQDLPSSRPKELGRGKGLNIDKALKSMGVKWVKRVNNYNVSTMVKALREARTSRDKGLKVIVAEGECQLARQRRVRPAMAKAVARGDRVVRTRYWVDEETCTGDHSCIRLSGCPSLTIKPNPDPLRTDPVAHVNNDCVGCGLCGEVSHAAQLCPSFAQIDILQNPTAWDRFSKSVSDRLIRLFGGDVDEDRPGASAPGAIGVPAE
ncbi:indolepyruvate ferredoxin oxidoreductase [Alphaproteobacteria bacterium GH1-50]|uniref:Indolepyruvate ferredoxin oxidoreductase n=1 Tax=Kangsaoukella pontilimi TaxID=2691042 RepID=A0A7C9ND95_9RHOB|nr:indolepyruvate ferredoxin oxidoreductase subunit alpha [Kangsaoukella pontilimi]MXQ07299.1 indolepyruvate ferredoxin oxidoreductase [Kangsaoukella pontilimi]